MIFGCISHLAFLTQISGRNFLPELCGEVHPETAPLQDLCCALESTEQSTFRGGEQKGGKWETVFLNSACAGGHCARPMMKIIPTTPTPPYLQKICPQIMPYNGGPYGIKVGQNQGISTENMAYGPPKYGMRTPPLLCHMNRFYWGGVVFNLLI